jgi:hypothetical protein
MSVATKRAATMGLAKIKGVFNTVPNTSLSSVVGSKVDRVAKRSIASSRQVQNCYTQAEDTERFT